MVDILIGLTPALFLGPLGLTLALIGGSVKQQLVGQLSGALLIALVALFFITPHFTTRGVVIAFLSGIVCAGGIGTQLISFRCIGVSRTMPISTGLQLVFMCFAGIVIFGEWTAPAAKLIGGTAVVLIILGVAGTSYTDPRHKAVTPVDVGHHAGASAKTADAAAMRKGFAINVASALMLAGYVVMVQLEGLTFTDFVVPQSCGMAFGALMIAVFWRDGSSVFSKKTVQQFLTSGLLFGAGVVMVQISTQLNGVATGFPLSQLGVIIAVVGGIAVLKEQKTSRELALSIGGIVVILIGAALVGYSKTL